MKYEIPKRESEFILDDSMEKETLDLIGKLIGKDLDIEIKNQGELIDFINNPENYLQDKDTIKEIKAHREIIFNKSDCYRF